MITSFDGLIAGLRAPEQLLVQAGTGEQAGGLHSTFYMGGRPGAAAAPSPGLAGAALTSYGGQIPFPAAVSGQSTYLARFSAGTTGGVAAVLLLDRLWHNSGLVVTTTTAQTVNSVTFPARDENGSTNGEGVMLGLEVVSSTTNGSAISNTTVSYTNSAGVSGRTATLGAAPSNIPATATAGTFVPLMLAAGDTGVRSVQSVTLGTSLVTGSVSLVAYRQVADIYPGVTSSGDRQSAIELGFPRLYDGTVPFLVYMLSSATIGTLVGQVVYVQG